MRKWAKGAFNDLREELDQRVQKASSGTPPIPSNRPPQLQANPQAPRPTTPNDIVRYRYQFGTNLGSIFVLERWMFGSMFHESANGGSELDAVTSHLKTSNFEATRSKFRCHWQNALTDADFRFLTQSAHANTIRLPIGYFTLGPQFCFSSSTPFSSQISQIYAEAWPEVVSLVSRCASHGIGVLIDFHALPGGANSEEHSGTSHKKAALWSNKHNLDLALQCLTFLASEITNNPSLSSGAVTGLQLCNEAVWAASGLYDFYIKALQAISSINPTLPVYISDSWDLSTSVNWALRTNRPGVMAITQCPIIIDTHKYYTFSDADRSKGPPQIISEVQDSNLQFPSLNPQTTSNVFDHSGATAVFIGEYSNTLDTATWARHEGPSSRLALTREFGRAQSLTWSVKTMGCTYWSYKFDWGNHSPGPRGLVHTEGGDWGFRNQIDNDAILPPSHLTFSKERVNEILRTAESRRDEMRSRAYSDHVNYWDGTSPNNPSFKHDLYAYGYDLGFRDALTFFSGRLSQNHPGAPSPPVDSEWLGADRIGALDLWVCKRMGECGMWKERETAGWEWEQGFRKGVGDFQALF